MMDRQTVLLRPMQAGASGYARLHTENGITIAQVHARGVRAREALLFAYLGGRAQKLGQRPVNAHGEASMEAEAPSGLRGLILIADPPSPLMVGLVGPMDGGALMDVKNAALALCEAPKRREPEKPAVRPVAAQVEKPLPREIFLPAIDPRRSTPEPLLPPPRPEGPPVDALPALRWPRAFGSLKPYFETNLPQSVFDAPGWRFVRAAAGLCIGISVQDARVRRVAYAYEAGAPSVPREARPLRGLDGRMYQVLWQDI